MTLKLYNRSRTGLRYWWAWEFFGTVMVQEGRVGDCGRQRVLAAAEDQSEEEFIQQAADKLRARGYSEIPRGEHHSLVVQYRLPTWGAPEDLAKAGRVEERLNYCLGSTGNGHCTGNDIGSGTVNVHCLVVDPLVGAACAEAELREHRLIKGVIIAVELDNDFRVVYPKRFKGSFSLA
jgi:hypothetical protein